MSRAIRIEVERHNEHLIDCHMVIDNQRSKSLRLKKQNFRDFLERVHHEVYSKGSQIEELVLTLGR
jgi:hypothetical protein